MKSKLFLAIGGLFILSQAAMAAGPLIAPQTFNVSATMPKATQIGITVSSVTVVGNNFTVINTTALSFDPMTFIPGPNIFAPSIYFALDIAPLEGGGLPDTTLTYSETANPNGVGNGLGTKSGATFVSETYTSSSTNPTEASIAPGKVVMNTLSSTNVPASEFTTGQWLRVYLGICTGNVSTDPTGCKPFTNADKFGLYSGNLLVTATVV